MTRVVLEILSAKGLCLELFTVTLRHTVYSYDEGPDMCHLRVHRDPKKSTIVSAKRMTCNMECFGDLSNCYFPSVVKEKTGFVYDYEEDV